jgi:hypothetical protein
MKKIFLGILFAIGFLPVFACVCVTPKLVDAVSFADFIATAKISKVVPDSIDPTYKNVTIEIINLYKGERITTLRINTADQTSCSFLITEHTEWLFFAGKNAKGEIGFGACSSSEQIDRKFPDHPRAERNYKRSIAFKLEVLSYLRDKKINPVNAYELSTVRKPALSEKFQGANVSRNEFAIYQLTVGTEMDIQNIRVLKELKDQKLSTELYNYLKTNLAIYKRQKSQEIFKTTELIFIIYAYPAEDGDQSFLSDNFL